MCAVDVNGTSFTHSTRYMGHLFFCVRNKTLRTVFPNVIGILSVPCQLDSSFDALLSFGIVSELLGGSQCEIGNRRGPAEGAAVRRCANEAASLWTTLFLSPSLSRSRSCVVDSIGISTPSNASGCEKFNLIYHHRYRNRRFQFGAKRQGRLRLDVRFSSSSSFSVKVVRDETPLKLHIRRLN